MRNDRENLIVDLTFNFALEIVVYCELLEENKKFIIAKQLLRSGTSIGANTRESQNAESKADFIHKLKIAAKEADEAQYWLLICQHSKKYPEPGEELFQKLSEIIKVLSKIISTAKKNKTI